jgi:hypothetical protein
MSCLMRWFSCLGKHHIEARNVPGIGDDSAVSSGVAGPRVSRINVKRGLLPGAPGPRGAA